jgi:UDP-N-acetylmuramate dehydrogenase
VIASVTALTREGAVETYSGAELDFSYRRSCFSGGDKIILSANVTLSPAPSKEIKAKMRELVERRRASQPLDLPSAGSAFRRPPGGFAAKLIDEAGLRGFAIGGAQVSEKHAGFIVNRGGASFTDVVRLIAHVQETVYKQTGITLTPEIKIIGG